MALVAADLDPRYEFAAPKYFDFTAEESGVNVNEAEHWFEAALGYEDFAQADEKKTTAPAVELKAHHPTSADENDENQPPRASENISKVAQASSPVKASPLKEIPLNLVEYSPAFAPETVPVKRSNIELCKGRRALALTAPKNSMRNITRYARDTVMKKMKKSIDKLIFRDDCGKKKQKIESGCKQVAADKKEQSKPTLTVPSEFQHWMDKRAHCRVGKENCNSDPLETPKVGSPFISLAEKVLKFQFKTPERFRHHSLQVSSTAFLQQPKSILKLTVPKEPELVTSHRARPHRVKSTAELEEEMLMKIPKFKARPVNKKMFEAPSLPPVPKSNPQQPEFQEFHLRTTERAQQHVCSSSAVSTDASVSDLNQRRKSAPDHYIEPHEPNLHTAARARPAKVKSREELEAEELAKMPKFKARPLNKKIFESRGDLGIFRSQKRQLTVPVEFHFATDERCQQQQTGEACLMEKLEKLSLASQEPQRPAGPTIPRPFNLVTEHRGEMTKMKFMQELFERELEERNLRVPKANPLPFTTDIPSIPPRPEPKECTVPEPFDLESVARHEEEIQRRQEELSRLDLEEMAMRRFYAHPAPSYDAVFIPERSYIPPTEPQGFVFRADARAAERAEFDRKVEEKQNHYRQLRDEVEASRRVEEEKLIKALRREMVPQARPMPVFGRPFIPHRSTRGPTRAVSPKLRVLARKERRRSTEQRQSTERSRSLDQRRASSFKP